MCIFLSVHGLDVTVAQGILCLSQMQMPPGLPKVICLHESSALHARSRPYLWLPTLNTVPYLYLYRIVLLHSLHPRPGPSFPTPRYHVLAYLPPRFPRSNLSCKSHCTQPPSPYSTVAPALPTPPLVPSHATYKHRWHQAPSSKLCSTPSHLAMRVTCKHRVHLL